MNNSTVLITGGTGLIGKALTKSLLDKGYRVIILSRNPDAPANRSGESRSTLALWDINRGTIDPAAIRDATHIIHLAGANVGEKRWTQKRKKEIIDSRVRSGELLVKALKEIPNQVRTVISSSAIGWYGPDPVNDPAFKGFSETDPSSNDFLGTTCKAWEEAIRPVVTMGKRLVTFRTGIVLSREGGAYPEYRKPVSFGLATILGNGKQAVSWIHLDDLVRMYVKAVEDESLSGVYNAVAPTPVKNKDLILAIAKLVKGWFYIPVYIPAAALKLVLGEMSMEVLKSATVSCGKIHNKPFTFLYPSIEAAVRHLEDQKNQKD